MKLILLNDVKKLGKKDEIIEVKDGYGKFLVQNKDAVICSSKSKEVLNKQQEKRELDEENLILECTELKKKLEKEKLNFKVKIGENGKLFGSVSSKQIHDELVKKGYKIDKKKINIKTDINAVGVYEVDILLHKKVTAKLKVNVQSE